MVKENKGLYYPNTLQLVKKNHVFELIMMKL